MSQRAFFSPSEPSVQIINSKAQRISGQEHSPIETMTKTTKRYNCLYALQWTIQLIFVFSIFTTPTLSIADTTADNGLSGSDQAKFYHLAEGSEVIPLSWLMVLQNKNTGKLFLQDVDMFGLLSDASSVDNPYGLPIGLTAADTIDPYSGIYLGKMVGINCAACHVGQLAFNGSPKRIDGMPNLFDINKFYLELAGSAKATAMNPKTLWNFFTRLAKLDQKGDYSRRGDSAHTVSVMSLQPMRAPTSLNAASYDKAIPDRTAGNLEVLSAGVSALSENLSNNGPLVDYIATLSGMSDALKQDVTALSSQERGAIIEDAFLRAYSDFDVLKTAGQTGQAFATYLEEIYAAQIRELRSRESLQQIKDERAFNFSEELFFKDEEVKVPRPKLTAMGGGNTPLRLLENTLEIEKVQLSIGRRFAKAIRLLYGRAVYLSALSIKVSKPTTTAPGYGRIDAFGSARNMIFHKSSPVETNAPVSYPHLWGMDKLEWFHWDANTNSLLQRNVGQAIGLGAAYNSTNKRTTLQVSNILELERLARKIQTPSWPGELLGQIDEVKASRGKLLFERKCAVCHINYPPTGKLADIRINLEEIGTDQWRAMNFAKDFRGKHFSQELRTFLHDIVKQYATDEQSNENAGSQWRTTKQYVARPLAGVWATAPYLHNGSVPSLYDLLLPATERPKVFRVGQREFDPERVGYATSNDERYSFLVDTLLPGNSNSGHEYGADLSKDAKMDLLEFLKGL